MTSYRLSYSAANLMVHETSTLCGIWLEQKDWSKVAMFILKDNVFQRSTQSGSVRLIRELRVRIETLNTDECLLLTGSNFRTKAQMAFLACLRAYPIIAEFCIEVLLPKFQELKWQLIERDYWDFIESKVLLHPSLESTSEQSKRKLRQVLFKMLEQVGLLESTRSLKLQRLIPTNDILPILLLQPNSIQQLYGLTL